MGFGDVLDAAFSLYRKSYVALVVTMAIVNVPVLLLQVFVSRPQVAQIGGIANLLAGHRVAPGGLPPINAATTVPIYLLFLVGAIAGIAIVDQVYRGGAANVGAAYRTALQRLLATVGLGIVGFLAVAAGMVAFVIPGLVIGVYLSQSLFLVVLEKEGVFRAIGRSVRLVRGFFWRVIGISVVSALIYYVVVGLLGAALGGIVGLIFHATIGLPGYFAALAVVGFVLQTLLPSFATVALYVLFMDLRVRKEGLDLLLADAPTEA